MEDIKTDIKKQEWVIEDSMGTSERAACPTPAEGHTLDGLKEKGSDSRHVLDGR